MIINKQTKGWQTRSDAPNINFMADIEPDNWLLLDETTPEGQTLMAKIVRHAPYIEFVLDSEDNLIDVTPTDPPSEATEEQKEIKLAELSRACSQAIVAGCDVVLSNASGHISLTAEDQINLTAALNAVEQGAVAYPYHLDGQLCAMFPAADIRKLAEAASGHKLYHTTYYNHLAVWVRRCTESAEVHAITYGAELPEDLAANMAAILGGVASENNL